MGVRIRAVAYACLCFPAAAGAAGNADILAAARSQVGITAHYDPAYRSLTDYLPGEIVAWDLGRGILTAVGTPFVVHNIGSGAREEDILFRYTIIGHYPLPALPAGESVRPTGATR